MRQAIGVGAIAFTLLAAPAAAAEVETVARGQLAAETFDAAFSPAGHAAVAYEAGTYRVSVRFAEPGARFGARRVLTRDGTSLSAAVGPRGDAVVVWSGLDRGGVFVAHRPAGGTFGPAVRIGARSTTDPGPQAAIDAQGAVTVLWTTPRDRLLTRVRSPDGVWSPRQGLGGADAYDGKLAVTPSGAATAAWLEGDFGKRRLFAAERRPGEAFGPAAEVLVGRRGPESIELAANDRGDAVIAWVHTFTTFSTHAVFRAPGGAFGPPAALSRGWGAFPGVWLDDAGRALLVWRDNRRGLAHAQVREPSGEMRPAALLTRRATENTDAVALPGAVAWLERSREVRLADVTPDGTFTPARTVLTRRGLDDMPHAFAPATGLAFVYSTFPLRGTPRVTLVRP